MYEVSYYAEVGQHGAHAVPSRKALTAEGVRLRKDSDLLMVEGIVWEQTANGRTEKQVTIYKMTLNYMLMLRAYSDTFEPRYAEQYLAAAAKCLRTGRAVTFRYH